MSFPSFHSYCTLVHIFTLVDVWHNLPLCFLERHSTKNIYKPIKSTVSMCLTVFNVYVDFLLVGKITKARQDLGRDSNTFKIYKRILYYCIFISVVEFISAILVSTNNLTLIDEYLSILSASFFFWSIVRLGISIENASKSRTGGKDSNSGQHNSVKSSAAA